MLREPWEPHEHRLVTGAVEVPKHVPLLWRNRGSLVVATALGIQVSWFLAARGGHISTSRRRFQVARIPRGRTSPTLPGVSEPTFGLASSSFRGTGFVHGRVSSRPLSCVCVGGANRGSTATPPGHGALGSRRKLAQPPGNSARDPIWEIRGKSGRTQPARDLIPRISCLADVGAAAPSAWSISEPWAPASGQPPGPPFGQRRKDDDLRLLRPNPSN